LEKYLGMGSGYVLNFSDRTFQEFVFDAIGKDIYVPKYNLASGSKANCLRGFWKEEPNYVVGKLLSALLTYSVDFSLSQHPELLGGCRRVCERLVQGAPVEEMDAIRPNSSERDFEVLAKSVNEAIDKNEPETGLDRLHTFTTKYLRSACEKHGIAPQKEKPLHSLMGEYIKCLKKEGIVESEMTERILKSSISTLEAFNDVRNNRSFAHDNRVLNYDEALLIFSHVAGAIRFITAIERNRATQPPGPAQQSDPDEIPF
jgi:hypothetical protein